MAWLDYILTIYVVQQSLLLFFKRRIQIKVGIILYKSKLFYVTKYNFFDYKYLKQV